MQIIKHPDIRKIDSYLLRPTMDFASLEASVETILLSVKQEGDAAIQRYTELFDKVVTKQVQYSPERLKVQAAKCAPKLKAAIKQACENIQLFHEQQQDKIVEVETMPGVKCWRKSIAIERVGLYIPGGTAPLFSSVLMLAVPARIAGCSEIVLCTPPNKDGDIHPAIAYAAILAGVKKVFLAGGVQAIGAMAFGTESVPKVDKVFGPGNQYVTKAKQIIARGDVAIDMPAGPSEVLVFADDSANPAFVAADLLSQAEHGIDSQVVLLSVSEDLVNETLKAVDEQLAVLPRKDIAVKALEHSKSVIVKNRAEALQVINAYAPEHLILLIEDYMEIADGIINAGSVFLGHYTPESAGDYASGTNHTLPTNGYARAYSGVSLDSFVKKVTFQEITRKGIQNIGPIIETMAAAEELDGHKNAVTVRLNSLK